MDTPLISIIIPTRNSARTLERCIRSVKNQRYLNTELIVVDNNSTDETKNIAEKYADKVFNQGPERSAQRNFGVQNSSGEYVVIIDSDMELSENVIKNCLEKIESNENIAGIIIPEESIGEGFWAQCKRLERSFYVGVEWMEAARFFRKDVFRKVGGYDENMVSGEDWDLSQRIEAFGKIDRINDLIFHNEGRISLIKTITKKFYYAGKFSGYAEKNKNNDKFSKQTGVVSRYGLFFYQPKKLFKNPILGIGMLLMKTCEFGLGFAGYILCKAGRDKIKKINNLHERTEWPKISFIIPTYNAEKYLQMCLESIVKQDYPKDKIEILIIDGGSKDRTVKIAKKFNTRILINDKRIAEYGKTIGIKESKGEYFILLDSDNEIVEYNWLKEIIRPILEHPELFGVESPLSYKKPLKSLDRYFARMRIADPLAKYLASKPTVVNKFDYYSILKFSKNAALITGANGFLWNKRMVMKFTEWYEKFEEANFSTFIHEKTGANYAISEDVSIRHYYCSSLSDYLAKRKKIALKIKGRIQNKEYVWVNKNNFLEIAFYTIYFGTIIGPTIEACYKNIRHRTFDYSWHPAVGFLTVWIYSWNFIFND